MNPNPVLTVLKIAAFAILAFVTWISFWHGNRQEEKLEGLKREVGGLREELAEQKGRLREGADAVRKQSESVDRLSGKVEGLTDVLRSGAFVPAGAPAGSEGAGPAPAATAARPSGDAAPAWVTGKARELWGRYPNYLEADPDAVKIPPLDTAGIDPKGRIRGWLGPALSGLNPLTKSDGGLSRYIMLRCLESMADNHVLNPYKYAPALAVRAEHDADYKEWVVWMRPGVRWHAPQVDLDKYPHLKGVHEVTARDVKFTLDLVLNPDVDAGARRSYYSECSGIEVVDDHCFIVRWKKKQFNAIAWTLSELWPLPEFLFAFDEGGQRYAPDRVGAAFNDHWFYRENHFIGCGPYYLVEYDKSSHCLMRRFDDYYDPARLPPVRECWFDIFPDRNLQVIKLRSGEEDYGSLLPNMWEEWRKDPESPLAKGQLDEAWMYTSQYGFIAWKQTHPIFKDGRVRRAMTLACDRPRIVSTLRLGKGKVITGPHHLASACCPPDLQPLPFDLAEAKALLEESGWKDADGNGVLEKEIDGQVKEFRFTAMIPQNIEWKAVFEIFKEDLSKIGVIMSLDQLHWQQFSERLDARTFECTALYWDTTGWDDDLYQIWHSSQIKEVPSSNFIEFQDAEVDRLIEQVRETFDVPTRVALQRRAHARIAELQPYTFVDTIQLPSLWWKDRIGNVRAGMVYKAKPFLRTFCWTALAR